MPSNDSGSSGFTTFIDLTSKAQKAKQQEAGAKAFAEPDPPLPEAQIETLPPIIQDAIRAAGWPSLMPVQEKAIPYLIAGRDIIVQSRTGSGKTGAFLLPLFQVLDADVKATQALIMTPTRELARQIHEEFERMKRGRAETEGLQGALVYGGVKYAPQIKALRDGVQVVIGTPGRILDHLERGNMDLDRLEVLVFDEADEMLSMGFYPAMRRLKRYLPAKRQSYMFSATIPQKVRRLAQEFLQEPGFLSLSVGQVGVDLIEHRYYITDQMHKDRVLVRLIEMENPDSAIIFCNTKRDVGYLTQFLRNYGHDADEISGDLTQRAREEAMDRIRKGELRFLVATDVAARGIDISDLSHVIMYDVPQDPEYYVHRSGRTARAGKTGTAIVLVTHRDERDLLRIARHYDIDIEKRPIPEPADVEARVAERMTVVLEDEMRDLTAAEQKRLAHYVPLAESLAREEPGRLAMLLDALYHRTLHPPSDEDADAQEAPRQEEEAEAAAEPESLPALEEVAAEVNQRFDGLTNLAKERLQRFVPLAEALVDEEPELLAMLLDDFHRNPPPEPVRRAQAARQEKPPRSEGSGGGRGRGRRR